MSNLTSVAKDRLAKKAQAAERAKDHINSADASARAPQKRLNVEIPEDLHKALKRKALDDDTNVRELVIKALKDALRV